MKKVVVTTSWDDGHVLDIKLAHLLKKYGIKGTFYISPLDKEIKSEERLKKEEIVALSEYFEIGAHTMTHPRLTHVSEDVAKDEIIQSKKYLEEIVKKDIVSFCYPAGYYNEKIKKIVQDIGFQVSRTVDRFHTRVSGDTLALPTTIHVYRHWSDIVPILKEVGIRKFVRAYLNWDELAISLFEKTARDGGVFHLWGHSWEIERNKDWSRLERVLQHISQRQDVQYVTNSELV